MRRFTLSAALLCFVLPAAARAAEPSDGGVDLLRPPSEMARGYTWKYYSEDAKSTYDDVWSKRGDVLVCKGSPRGYLYLDHDFTNFVLRLQWRYPADKKAGNGGVLLRKTGPDKIWPKSLEAQLNAGDAGDFWGLDGYVLDGPADRKKSLQHPQFGHLINLKKTEPMEKPLGQWNQYEIVVRGDTVTLTVNGKKVNEATGCQPVAGKICLTAEGDEIHFRNIRFVNADTEPGKAP